MTGTLDGLTRHLFDAPPGADPLADEVSAWLAGSARFRAFAERHRDKIRKKLRGATNLDARRDVRAELRVAHLLLGDRRFELAFEAYGSATGGPDFTITYRGTTRFNLEVTRPRRAQDEAGLAATIAVKLRQLPPSIANVLLVATGGTDAAAVDVAGAVASLRARVDAKDEAFFTTRGFAGSRGFHERLRRLGAVLAWCEAANADARAVLWSNDSARIAVPDRARRACLACLRAG